MKDHALSDKIRQAALEFGFEECGIIRVEEMRGYADALRRRMNRFPESQAELAAECLRFTKLEEQRPWGRSIVVCTRRYGRYRLPEHLKGVIGKYYLTDSRRDVLSEDYQKNAAFEAFLGALGLKIANARNDDLLSMRWAAAQAGLGLIRKNNFLYSAKGSWLYIEAWLIDRELELKHVPSVKPCPDNCSLCIKACPTKALPEPYQTNMGACVCFLTYKTGCVPNNPHHAETGLWIYGCDVCQDACPFNKQAWTEEKVFPSLAELGRAISPEQIIFMDYDQIRMRLLPKFWYIDADALWKWKANALNSLRNSGSERFEACLARALDDEEEQVRLAARQLMQV